VAQTTQSCLYLAVPASSPFKTFDDMVAYAKEHPGELKLADIIGGISHFPAVTMMNELGIKFGVVQTGGTSQRFASLKGGHTDMAFMSPGWIKRGGDELRGLLWLGPTRPAEAEGMPTAKEVGLDVNACLNRRFWAPKGTSQEQIDYFADVLEKVMQTPELIEYHQKQLSDIRFRKGDELKQDIAEEMATFQKAADDVKGSMQ
jgi:tripartite-type tricarboxylate transporter receptor subunit TctC